MKTLSSIFIVCLIFSCTENNIVEVIESQNDKLIIEFSNDSLIYDFVDNSIYTPLYWNDNDSRWDFVLVSPGAICQMEPPEIILLAGEEYTILVDDLMPEGTINARLRFHFINTNNSYETISKIFEYY